MKQDKSTALDSQGRLQYLRLKQGDIIAKRYKVIAESGHGAMGRVFHCDDMKVEGREVVLKTVFCDNDSTAAEALRREFKIMTSLHHENIVPVIDWVEDDFRGYIVMEYLKGETLADYLENHRKSEMKIVFAVAERIAAALNHMHEKRIIHRDVSPNNIIVQINKGNVRSVTLIDFSLSLQISEDSNYVICFKKDGTLGYMSPEQMDPKSYHGQLTTNSDQHSLAVLVCKMLTGEFPPYNCNEPTSWKTLNNALMKALNSQPERRFKSCSDFVTAMKTRESFQRDGMNLKDFLVTLRQKHVKWLGYVLAFALVLKLFSWLLLGQRIPEEDNKKETIDAECEQIKAELGKIEEESRKMKEKYVKVEKEYKKIKAERAKKEEDQMLTGEEKTEILENKFVGQTKCISKEVVTEYKKGTMSQKCNQQRQEFVIIINGFKYEFIFVPPGTFMMGGAITGNDCDNDNQPHLVTLTHGYWISKTTVTNSQYFSIKKKINCLGYMKSKPAVNISWTDAKGFCTKLTREARKTGQISEEYEFMLTTESQWEKAVQEGYIVIGEEWEWCLDMYERYSSQPSSNPIGSKGTRHVIRGWTGCYSSRECRITDRERRIASYKASGLGFRVVLVPSNRLVASQAEKRI